MKTIKAGMKNWQTTLIGAVLAGAVALQSYLQNGDLAVTDPQVIVAVLIAVLSFVMRDASQTSEGSGLK